MLKKYPNRPAHIWNDNQCYFITATVYKRQELFINNERLAMLQSVIFEKIQKFGWEILVWALMPNHYHFIANCKDGETLPKLLNEIHGKSSILLNKIDSVSRRKIWQNYWDVCLKTEKDYFQTMNYIHLNPVKHSFAKRMSEYEFSSFNNFYLKSEKGICESFFREFPPKARVRND